MGMFSYCCNGCGHELHEGEAVRIDGRSGVYDGYGGLGEQIKDYDNPPSCWHNACYQKASYIDKKANKPSKHAENQGFGPACLEFLPDYDPSVSIQYMVYFEVWDEDKGSDIIHLCQDNGKYLLLSENEYEKAYSKFNRSTWQDWELSNSVSEMTEEEKTRSYQDRRDFVESKIGMKRPERIAAKFESLEQALGIANNFLPECDFYLIITGKQARIEGAVYMRRKYKDSDQVKYKIGEDRK